MSAHIGTNIVILTKDTAQSYSDGSSSNAVNRLLSVLEVDTNFINLKEAIIQFEQYASATLAPLAAPSLTGNATLNRTIAASDDSISIANTQFVQDVVAPILSVQNDSQLGNAALFADLATKADLSASNTFTVPQYIQSLSYTQAQANTSTIVTSGYVTYHLENVVGDVSPLSSNVNAVNNLGNSTSPWDTLYVNSIIPVGLNSTIGTAAKPFKEGHFANNTVFIGTAGLSQGTAGGLVLPVNSSIGDDDSVVPRNLISTELDKGVGATTSGPNRSLKTSLTASGNITAKDALVLNSDGTVSTISTSNDTFIGFANSTASTGNSVEVIISGPVTGLSGLTAGDEVFIGVTGTLRNSRQFDNDVKIGVAQSASTLFLYSTSTIDLYALSSTKTELQDFSVNTLAAGTNALSYNSSTGVFDFTPVNLSTYATQLYVDTEIANLVDSAPTSLDTLNELAAALNDDANFATTVTNSLATKAPLADPALTGTPTAPTATSGTNTTQIATTEFVQTAVANDIELTDLSVSTVSASSGGALSYNNTTGVFTFTPADTSSFGNASLNSFSVTTGTPNSNGGLSYNNTTGVFTFTPADLSSYLTSYTETDPVVGAINGIVKADGAGNISAAVAGTDYSTFDAAFSSLTGTPTTLSGYGITDAAPLASPTFTGTPAAPTATTGDSSTQLATTAFVQGEIAGFSTSGGDSQIDFIADGAITSGTAVTLGATTGEVTAVATAPVAGAHAQLANSSSTTHYYTQKDALDYNDQDGVYQQFYQNTSGQTVGVIWNTNLATLTFSPGTPQTLLSSLTPDKYFHINGTSTGILKVGTNSYIVTNSSGTLSIGPANNVGAYSKIITTETGDLIALNGSDCHFVTVSGTTITFGSAIAIGLTPAYGAFEWSKLYNKLVAASLSGGTVTYSIGTISGTSITWSTAATNTTWATNGNQIFYHVGSEMLISSRRNYWYVGAPVDLMMRSSTFNGSTFAFASNAESNVLSMGPGNNNANYYILEHTIKCSKTDDKFGILTKYDDGTIHRALASVSTSGVFANELGATLVVTRDYGSASLRFPAGENDPAGYLAMVSSDRDTYPSNNSNIYTSFFRTSAASTKDSYLGIAQSTVADGDTVTVMLAGAISDVHSSLTPDTTMYVQDNGTISTTVSTVIAGKALNATSIQVSDSRGTFDKPVTFSTITGKPTTLAGYGITDGASTLLDIDIGSNDFITTGKAYYANMFATTGDLPSASTYHGMFAHVHGTGKAYFAHAGNWVELANNSQIFDGAWSSLTGTPTTLAGYGITDAASVSYVDTEIANLINSAPGALDTLDELAAALGDDANFSTTVTNNLALKAPLADPALTGTPTAPTATSGTNTTQIATTAFVQAAISGLGGGGGASVTVSGTAPSSPSAGDLWFDDIDLVLYVYYNDGTSNQWVQTNPSGAGGSSGGSSGGASVTVGNTAPTSPKAGDLWFDDDDLFLYVYIDDGSSTQWVKTNPSGGGSSSTWAEKTAAYTAEAGDRLIVDTSTAVTVTLPVAAVLGDEIRIIDGTGNAATNNITIARNGHNIEGSATDLTIDVDRAAFGLVYYNATQGWVMTER